MCGKKTALGSGKTASSSRCESSMGGAFGRMLDMVVYLFGSHSVTGSVRVVSLMAKFTALTSAAMVRSEDVVCSE